MSIQTSHRSLATQVQALDVPHGHLAVWALGQQGYLLKGGSHVVVIDPYLSDQVAEITGDPAFHRLVPVAIEPRDITFAEFVLSTHAHADHCDPKTLVPLMKASPQARLLTSYTGQATLLEAGVDSARIEVPPIDRPVRYGDGLTITAIPSAHYAFEPDEQGNPAYLGFILQMNGVNVYHSGDTIIYEGMIERLKAHNLDLACLPINGRDWFREHEDLVGNLDYREAADLASAAGVEVLLPSHNDMFAGNRINPSYLLDYLTTNHPMQRVHFHRVGELYYFAG